MKRNKELWMETNIIIEIITEQVKLKRAIIKIGTFAIFLRFLL